MEATARPRPLRVALYARVSTRDKDQDPELQLHPLREYAAARGWEATEYADHAAAGDLAGRTAWARLLADARRHDWLAEGGRQDRQPTVGRVRRRSALRNAWACHWEAPSMAAVPSWACSTSRGCCTVERDALAAAPGWPPLPVRRAPAPE